jgi:hypothetical protein
MGKAGDGKRSGEREREQRVMAGVRCPDPCGKIRFARKSDAKRVITRMKGRRGRMHAYRCHDFDDFWHVGHPPKALVAGRISREDIETRWAES